MGYHEDYTHSVSPGEYGGTLRNLELGLPFIALYVLLALFLSL